MYVCKHFFCLKSNVPTLKQRNAVSTASSSLIGTLILVSDVSDILAV